MALVADTRMTRLGREFMPPLDEGTILDMPVTIPRASITEVADDLKARDALLRSFPEVESVVGKAGRAETPTDPAPPDMVETVINLRPREHWPKRELRYDDARRQTEDVLAALSNAAGSNSRRRQHTDLVNDATMFALEAFDQATRDMAFQDYAQFQHELAPHCPLAVDETVGCSTPGKLEREPTTRMSQRSSTACRRIRRTPGESPDLRR